MSKRSQTPVQVNPLTQERLAPSRAARDEVTAFVAKLEAEKAETLWTHQPSARTHIMIVPAPGGRRAKAYLPDGAALLNLSLAREELQHDAERASRHGETPPNLSEAYRRMLRQFIADTCPKWRIPDQGVSPEELTYIELMLSKWQPAARSNEATLRDLVQAAVAHVDAENLRSNNKPAPSDWYTGSLTSLGDLLGRKSRRTEGYFRDLDAKRVIDFERIENPIGTAKFRMRPLTEYAIQTVKDNLVKKPRR
jgi:hypothetical protein